LSTLICRSSLRISATRSPRAWLPSLPGTTTPSSHWAKIRRDPANIIRTIVFEGEVAGNIGSWPAGDKRLLAYWIGREFWGRGTATAALAAFLLEVTHRPLHAFVARHNVGSIRVLQKCRFIQQDSAATVGEDGVEELLFALPQ
jgi:RimJ/RimL family protein N-acetyltransferase